MPHPRRHGDANQRSFLSPSNFGRLQASLGTRRRDPVALTGHLRHLGSRRRHSQFSRGGPCFHFTWGNEPPRVSFQAPFFGRKRVSCLVTK